jgi:hypothetical protein
VTFAGGETETCRGEVSSLAGDKERDNIRAMEVKREPKDSLDEARTKQASAGQLWYFVCLISVVLGAGGSIWFQATRPQSRKPAGRLEALSEQFYGPVTLSPEETRKLLRGFGVGELFRGAVARGDVPWNSERRPSVTIMPKENEYMMVDVDNRDVKAIANWFQKRIAPASGGIQLYVGVEAAEISDEPETISRVFTITAAKVQEITSAKEEALQRKLYDAIDAGELRLKGYPTISQESGKGSVVTVQDVTEADVYTLADWVRRQLPGSKFPMEMQVRAKEVRRFELLADGVREVTER